MAMITQAVDQLEQRPGGNDAGETACTAAIQSADVMHHGAPRAPAISHALRDDTESMKWCVERTLHRIVQTFLSRFLATNLHGRVKSATAPVGRRSYCCRQRRFARAYRVVWFRPVGRPETSGGAPGRAWAFPASAATTTFAAGCTCRSASLRRGAAASAATSADAPRRAWRAEPTDSPRRMLAMIRSARTSP
jgi:hypothetical protein